MNYAWVIDQRKCIGCHACTTACKSENEVPLSVDRTWVKYIEKGAFPNVQRHFGVLRCNHCANPPCVHICPVTAMFQRPDGVVEFDKDACIGCKACIAACPYDAIYIDPEDGTAAKCNFCSHRLDVGLEPACVVVCPEEALIFGDLEDPNSKVAQLVGREKTQVRKPEKNTDPKCFYLGADEAVLNPDVQTHDESGLYMWSLQRQEKHGATLDNNRPTGLSLSAALNTVTGARVAYDVHHDIPWGPKVSLYLWTKSMAAGAFLIAWLVWAVGRMGHAFPSPLTLGVGGPIIKMLGLKLSTSSPDWIYWLGPLLAGTALAATGALLVADLDRPERFWKILARPQWKSWLAIGSFIILAYALLLVALLGLQLAGPAVRATAIWSALFHLAMPAAVMTAIYTAFLFAQAKGRDLWQSPMLPLHLLVQAIIAGACITAISAPVVHDTAGVSGLCDVILVAALVTHVFLILVGEIWTEHSSRAKQRAISLMVSGPYSGHFWGGAIVAGVAVPLALLVAQMSGVSLLPATLVEPMAALLALAGLLAYEHSFVMAGQSIRLS